MSSLQQIDNKIDISECINFHPAHPPLLVAIVEAYLYQQKHYVHLLNNSAYYEFGVFQGTSIWFAERISRLFSCNNYLFYGFDSFQGLPKSNQNEEKAWFEGHYKADINTVKSQIKRYNGDLEKIHLIKGWFSKDLFASFEQKYHVSPPGVVVIDCDLYESCNEVLNYIMPKVVPGTILIFDEYYHANIKGEKDSFEEYLQKNPSIKVKEIYAYDEIAGFLIIDA